MITDYVILTTLNLLFHFSVFRVIIFSIVQKLIFTLDKRDLFWNKTLMLENLKLMSRFCGLNESVLISNTFSEATF